MIIVNGKKTPLPSPPSITQLLEQLGLANQRIAVERNGTIIPFGLWASCVLQAGDQLEIIQAVGGG